jgi:CRISPR-associated endoribonuclease Cas6
VTCDPDTIRIDAGISQGEITVSEEIASLLTMPRLALLRLDLVFAMDEAVELPPFRGNLWRGVLGPALKHIDAGLLPGLSTGEIAPGTLYRTLFVSPPPPDATRMRRYEATPHPYVIDAPATPNFQRLEAGATERIGLTLVGRAATAAEAVLAGFDFAARVGLGRDLGPGQGRGRGRLVEAHAVWRGDAPDVSVFDEVAGFRSVAATIPIIPPCPPQLRVILATPLRLVREGEVLGPRRFPPGALIGNLVRRVSMLTTFFGETPLETDFRRLKTMWEGLVAQEPMLALVDQKRWSASQRQELGAGGIIGSFMLDMASCEELFPYLWLGQWIHAGKGAVMGMGAIRLRAE